MNAGDEGQVRSRNQRIKFERERELRDLCSVLSTREGRRVFWRLIGKCRVFDSVWEQSARIHYNSGQQDVGQFILKEIVEADEGAYILMMKESKESMDKKQEKD
jgi:hypothetical protein